MDVRLQIKERLRKEGRNIIWLAHKFDVTPNHLRMVLRCERPLSQANLKAAKDLWPDNDFSEDKPLFKDDNKD
jgi:hypothetical protein